MADFLDMHGITSRLKQYYEGLGITAKEFSERTGISQTTLSSINTGKSNTINVDSINKAVAACTDLDGYWLLFGKEQSNSNKPEQIDLQHEMRGVANEDSLYSLLLDKLEQQTKKIAELEDHLLNQSKERQIEEIKVYFSDGSYRNYQNTESK